MSLSRKNYEAVANIINIRLEAAREADDQGAIGAICDTAYDLSWYFKTDNQAFQRDRFLEACGIQ